MTEPQMPVEISTQTQTTGRNEPCPCGSRKKYKRCHGVGASPKLTTPKQSLQNPGGMDMEALRNMDPQILNQFSQSLQKLPKGQLQRLQSLMQKAMSGKDIQTEAEEFEKTLPVEFQDMMRSMGMNMNLGAEPSDLEASFAPVSEMTEEQARELVEKAAAEGAISQEQAHSLLTPNQTEESAPLELTQSEALTQGSGGKLNKFWKNFSGKKGL